MRLAISNIAWDVAEDEQVVALLRNHRVEAIDIAPGKYFPRPKEATKTDILSVKRWWSERGIEITGMQALLFGTTGLNVFGSTTSQDDLLGHLGAVCRIGGMLGATRLVFGSPKNRDRTGLTDEEALGMAVGFFRRLGDKAAAEGVIVCLEPNPACYGANFMVTSAETAEAVKAIGHPAIRMQLDAGAITINEEDIEAVVSSYAHLIGHVHASEPDLAPLGDRGSNHARMGKALQQYLPNAIVSIEMVATQNEPHLSSIERALTVAAANYRSEDNRGLTQ
jgi:D-psicose/D-tagatose/L-ribulose 3-epimerase